MKIQTKMWAMVLGVAGLLVASPGWASLTLTFDEKGNSTSPTGGPTGITHEQHADSLGATANGNTPSGGGVTTLDYLFVSPVVPGTILQFGWVAIYDDAAQTHLSDLLHFDNSLQLNGQTFRQMFFYSIDNDGDLADHWIDSTLTYKFLGNNNPQNTTTISTDNGKNVLASILASDHLVKITENADGVAIYTPSSSTSPGFLEGTSTTLTYEFISSVPEPTTVLAGALTLLPFGAVFLQTLRKKRAA